MARDAQDARLADAGLAHEGDKGALREGLAEAVHDDLLGGGQPEVPVCNLLGEGRFREREVPEVGGAQAAPPFRPSALSRMAFGGSNAMWVGASSLNCGRRYGRSRLALPTASTGWSS